MKNYLLFATLSIVFASCSHEKLDKATSENDSLKAVVNERDSSIGGFINAFNDVERNLDSVTARQHLINLSAENGELKSNQKLRITEGIKAINLLMEENRKNLTELKRKLKNSSYKNVQLEKAIATINNQLAQKDVELTALNEKLANLNVQVEQLQTSVYMLTEENFAEARTIAEQTNTMHTSYYIIANTKELEDSKLIDRKGGLLGLGKTSKISPDADNSKFTKIDYTQTLLFPINGRNAKLITSHPTDSYKFDMDASDKKVYASLTVLDPERFWSASKYLVIEKK